MSIDLNGIKEQIQTILQEANTTTGSPVDLSANLTRRVQQIFKINPLKIPIQASLYPYVTTYYDQKSVLPYTIAKNQATAKREANVDIKIIGTVWDNRLTTVDIDEADEECETLMENIEEILRSHSDLNHTVTWSFPTAVTYHNIPIEKNTYFRAGIMNLEAKIYY